jgi:hypothetical protein
LGLPSSSSLFSLPRCFFLLSDGLRFPPTGHLQMDQ